MAGQSSGLISNIKPVKEVVKEVIEEFKETISALCDKQAKWWR